MHGICSTSAVLRKQLHRFQAVADFDAATTIEEFCQVAAQSQSSHLCAVSVHIVGSPSGLNRMHISGAKGRREKLMPAIDSGIKKADMGHRTTFRHKVGSIHQVLKPLTLLIRATGIKEFRCLLGPPQFCNAVESKD